MRSFRLDKTGRLGNARRVEFSFDGKRYAGREGDTLASALLANGIHLTGRSFKYHRPRGILGSGPEEPNALMEISRDAARRQPNIRATMQPLYDGLKATSQNRWPSLGFDIGGVNGVLSRFLTAGFYYKTFMWPKSFWHKVYEPNIRAAAGLGRAPESEDPERYANRYLHVDVLVAGGGPAGLAAALAAGQTGASVLIADENLSFGGWLKVERHTTIDGVPAMEWVADAVARLQAMANVRVMPRTTVFGYHNHNMLSLAEQLTEHLANPDPALPRERLWQVRARRSCSPPDRSSARWSSPTTTVPASCSQAPAGSTSTNTASPPAAASRSSPPMTRPTRRRSTSPKPASTSRSWSTFAPIRTRR